MPFKSSTRIFSAFLDSAALAAKTAFFLASIRNTSFLYINYDDFMILNIEVPQSGHLPFDALRLFFIVTSLGSFISFFPLHFTQYASISSPPFSFINKI